MQTDPVVLDTSERFRKGYMENMMTDCMSIPLTINNKTFTIPVGIKTGMNWNEVS